MVDSRYPSVEGSTVALETVPLPKLERRKMELLGLINSACFFMKKHYFFGTIPGGSIFISSFSGCKIVASSITPNISRAASSATSQTQIADTDYLTFLFTAPAKTVFEKYGFAMVCN